MFTPEKKPRTSSLNKRRLEIKRHQHQFGEREWQALIAIAKALLLGKSTVSAEQAYQKTVSKNSKN